jgi:hypothetical protein
MTDKVYIVWFIWNPDKLGSSKGMEKVYTSLKKAKSYVRWKVSHEFMPREHFKIEEVAVQ